MVRNNREIGINLQEIVSRLMANDKLVNLLYYTDKDPLGRTPLTEEQKQKEVFEKLIKVVPRIDPKEDSQCEITIKVVQGITINANTEFRKVKIEIEVFVPLTQWLIKNSNLRPFAIMGEIEESLHNKEIVGLGKIQGGDFELNFFSEENSNYIMTFWITVYG